MLKLSKKSEYALMAVKYIALQQNKSCVTAREISKNYNLPYELVSKVLQQLTRYNVVLSIQGARGGYKLSKSTSDLSLIDIISAVEPRHQITNCMMEGSSVEDCEHYDCCVIRDSLIKVQSKIDNLLKNIMIREII